MKYFIDKYNILYVYPMEYAGAGRIYTWINTLQYVGIIISQLIQYQSLYTIYATPVFFWAIGPAQLIVYFFYLLAGVLPIGSVKKWVGSGYMTEQEELQYQTYINVKKDEQHRKQRQLQANRVQKANSRRGGILCQTTPLHNDEVFNGLAKELKK